MLHTLSETKILDLHPRARRRAPPNFYLRKSPPRHPPGEDCTSADPGLKERSGEGRGGENVLYATRDECYGIFSVFESSQLLILR